MDSKASLAYLGHLQRVQRAVLAETARQLDLQRQGKFEHIAYDKECPELIRLAMLTEETGEVARALQNDDVQNLIEELIQLAAIAISWVAGIEARDGLR